MTNSTEFKREKERESRERNLVAADADLLLLKMSTMEPLVLVDTGGQNK
jgi:hypothetical protein